MNIDGSVTHQPDIGTVIVIINKDKYINNVRMVLNDSSKLVIGLTKICDGIDKKMNYDEVNGFVEEIYAQHHIK